MCLWTAHLFNCSTAGPRIPTTESALLTCPLSSRSCRTRRLLQHHKLLLPPSDLMHRRLADNTKNSDPACMSAIAARHPVPFTTFPPRTHTASRRTFPMTSSRGLCASLRLAPKQVGGRLALPSLGSFVPFAARFFYWNFLTHLQIAGSTIQARQQPHKCLTPPLPL
jgi:hypothetical protein